MSFTDDDLKRLKERTEKHDGCCAEVCLEIKGCLALIARLEAAEKVCNQLWSTFDLQYLEAWRKAAGK